MWWYKLHTVPCCVLVFFSFGVVSRLCLCCCCVAQLLFLLCGIVAWASVSECPRHFWFTFFEFFVEHRLDMLIQFKIYHLEPQNPPKEPKNNIFVSFFRYRRGKNPEGTPQKREISGDAARESIRETRDDIIDARGARENISK